MQCSRLFYPSAWLPRRAMHCGQKVTRLFDIENVGSGGRKANLAAIRDGNGGQQNKQHNSLHDKPFIVDDLGPNTDDSP